MQKLAKVQPQSKAAIAACTVHRYARPVQQALSRIVRQIVALARVWPKSTALSLGLASATGFAPLGLWPVTLIALAFLILQIAEAPTQRRAFGVGWAFGVGHFTLGLNWIATAFTYQAAMPAWLGWIAVVLLSLYLAVYPALATWGAWWIAGRLNPPRPVEDLIPFTLAFAATWIITEWLRSWVFTGFAWNPLSTITLANWYPKVFGPEFLDAVGTYGVSAFVILFAGWAALVIDADRAKQRRIAQGIPEPTRQTNNPFPITLDGSVYALILGLVAVAMLAVISAAFSSSDYVRPKTIPLTIVQPNVGQQDKWVGEKADSNFAKLAALTTPLTEEPRLILWPEAAIPDYLETGYPFVYYDRSPAEARARITDLMNPDDVMLLGALKLELDKSGEVVGARNAVMTIDANGRLGPRYDKAHLVPYGEYLPMRPVLSAIGLARLVPGDIDFWPGPGPRTIDLGRFGKVGVQICYEIIFSGQVVDRVNRPAFIFNPSNDAWFGSWGPPQHLAQARLRAIEEGLPVVRATPTGISAVIDADGRIRESLPMGAAGRIDTRLPPPHEPTLFARYGNILPLLFAGLLLAFAIASGRARR